VAALLVADGGAAAARPSGRPRRSRGMGRYYVRKVAQALLTLLGVLVVNFFLFRILPGDPIKNLTRNRHVSTEQMAALRRSFGLDKPLMSQFFDYLLDTLRGDLGISYQFNQPVTEVIASRVWPTVLLSGLSVILAAIIGFSLGSRAAWRAGHRLDRVATFSTLTLYAMPEFWLGLMLMVVFSVKLGLFPTAGATGTDVAPGFFPHLADRLSHLALPLTTLTLGYLAEYFLVMRSALLDERHGDYLVTARAKGLRDSVVRDRHALRNALLPTVTLLFLNLGFVVTGAITVETVFSWPGLGLLSEQALRGPDFPLLQGVFLVFSAGVVLMNLVADLLYPVIDPRIRTS